MTTTTSADPAAPGAQTHRSRGPAPREHERVPVRTCIGCRQRRPQPELVRLAVVDGQLTPGAGAPGRGAWLCRSTVGECFEQAAIGRRFGRALRADVDPASFDAARVGLVALVTRDTTVGGGTGKVSLRPAR